MSQVSTTKRTGTSKPETIKLIVTIAGKSYVLGILSFNTSKKEFSYHFTYPKGVSETHFDCDQGKLTARLDHITWHKHKIHIKRRDDVAIEQVEFENGPLFCDTPVVTPLYIESLYFADSSPCLRDNEEFDGWRASRTQEILRLEDSKGFSVMFVLVPSSTITVALLHGLQFLKFPESLRSPPCLANLCNETHCPGRLQLGAGWDLVILTSPYMLRIGSKIPEELGNSYRLPNYKNVPAAMTDLLMQANNLKRVGDRLE
ncbi:MAG: hypothetical protein Q8K75_03100 [Chlamydiales bacterium]|nr:hypothetical protein [Chlamydiales bacterium]